MLELAHSLHEIVSLSCQSCNNRSPVLAEKRSTPRRPPRPFPSLSSTLNSRTEDTNLTLLDHPSALAPSIPSLDFSHPLTNGQKYGTGATPHDGRWNAIEYLLGYIYTVTTNPSCRYDALYLLSANSSFLPPRKLHALTLSALSLSLVSLSFSSHFRTLPLVFQSLVDAPFLG